MAEKQKTGKGGTRKIGRNMTKCAKYKATGRREKNKIKHIAKDAKMKAKNKRANDEQ